MKLKILAGAFIVVIAIAVIGAMITGEETIETENQAGPGDAMEQAE